MPRVLLTGGSGFIGTSLLKHPAFDEALVIGRTQPIGCNNFRFKSLTSSTDFSSVLYNIEVVVHVAARAHVMHETSKDPLTEFRYINTLATLELAEQAMNAGVKRFIFISSIKVLGERTKKGQPFIVSAPLNPQDPYAISKAETESGLKKLAAMSDMEVVIIRPPLVYGKNVKGNFAKLLKLCASGIPMPLASIKNKRSLVAIENLVDLIVICMMNPKAKNQVFLVSDDCDMSTPELISLIALVGGYKSRLFKFPPKILEILLRCFVKTGMHERLCNSMQVDITYTKDQLNWTPPISPKDGIKNCWSNELKSKLNGLDSNQQS
jgi:UDP-glucose 4-epimerase